MKKRLRKKRHCGEFTEWGRQLIVTRNTKEGADAFCDAFILEAIEANNCSCGGVSSEDGIDFIIQLGMLSENPDSKFDKVAAWLDARTDVKDWKAGAMFDLSQ